MQVKPTNLLQCALWAALMWCFCSSPARAEMRLGTNLGDVTYYSSEWAFSDAMKVAKPWMTRRVGGSEWDSGLGDERKNKIPKDGNGWPRVVPFKVGGVRHTVHTVVPCWQPGEWTLRARGRGKLRVRGPGLGNRTVVLRGGGTTTVTLRFSGVEFNPDPLSTNPYPSIYLDILESDRSDRVRNIQLLLPGHTSGGSPFHRAFKERLAPFTTIRFMNWGRTNNSAVAKWRDRTRRNYYTQGGYRGVAWEWMVELANELDKDLWICVPHKVNNSYVRALARLMRDNVEPGRKIYIEYSNEVWNGVFPQSKWVNTNLPGRNLPQKYGARAKRVFSLFHEEFEKDTRRGRPSERLVRVLAGQAANPWVLSQAYEGADGQCDAIAIAPYFGRGILPEDVERHIPTISTLLQNEAWSKLDEVRDEVAAHERLARGWGKKLLCYEGGAHFVGVRGAENNNALTRRLVQASRSDQMRDAYRWRYLPTLDSGGVELFCVFVNVGKATKWGAWGALEYQDQPVGTNHGNARRAGEAVKWWAIQDWIDQNVWR